MSGNVRVKKTEVGDVTGFGRLGEEGRRALTWAGVKGRPGLE